MKKVFLTLLSFLMMAGCSKKTQVQETVPEIFQGTNCPYTFDVADFYTDYEDAQLIKNENKQITIEEAGTYLLSGVYTNGIVIDAKDSDIVRLVLENVTWENLNEEAIYVKSAKRVLISLPQGTTSTITSNDEDLNNLINAKSPLVFNGEGSLNLYANNKDAIQADQELVFISGNYEIEALDKAITSNQTLAVYQANFKIKTKTGDAISLSNEFNEGLVYLQNGKINIETDCDGISVDGKLVITDGLYQIQTTSADDQVSQKGIKASTSININGGSWQIDTVDDAIHSNQDCQITAGDFLLSSQGKGIHADANLTIDNGTLTITNCQEGLEAKVITINDGDMTISALDDGLNASDANSTVQRGAQTGCEIIFNGGTTTVYAAGDGIDSNDKIKINGGEIYVYSSGMQDAALDYESEMIVNGGTIIACGQNNMAASPTSASTQPSLALGLDTMTSGPISLLDEDGQTLASWQIEKSYNHVVISAPQIQLGSTYTCYTGDTSKKINIEQTLTTSGQASNMHGFNHPMDRSQDHFKPEEPPIN